MRSLLLYLFIPGILQAEVLKGCYVENDSAACASVVVDCHADIPNIVNNHGTTVALICSEVLILNATNIITNDENSTLLRKVASLKRTIRKLNRRCGGGSHAK